MTRQHNGYAESSPFSHWLRSLPSPDDSYRISNQNLDYIWHDYRDNWLITIEEKRYGGGTDLAQEDTHRVVAQMLELSSGQPVQTARGVRPAFYRGHFVVQFSHTTPDDSEWMRINGRLSTRDDLLYLLRCGDLNAVPSSA